MAGVGNVQLEGALHPEMRWGAGATERCYNDKRLLIRGRSDEEVIYKDPETVDTVGVGGARIKFLTIATEPTYIVFAVQGCNTTTSCFEHTDWTGGWLTHTQENYLHILCDL